MLRQLLIDIGNTRLKWVLMLDDSILAGGQWAHHGENGLALQQIAINELPEQIIVSNVAGNKLTSEINSWARDIYSLPVHHINVPSKGDGIENAYAVAEELGSDRWASMVACHRLYQADDVCIVDAGSAITIDLLTEKGIHLGGYILPGITSMRQTLSRDTMLKPDLKLDRSIDRNPGKSTAQCINNGSILAICQTIEAAVNLFENETGRKIQCVLTGGDSNQLSGKLNISHLIEPSLVLQGLAVIGKRLAQIP
jgi:type III pantothenate kinase